MTAGNKTSLKIINASGTCDIGYAWGMQTRRSIGALQGNVRAEREGRESDKGHRTEETRHTRRGNATQDDSRTRGTDME
jgi:hypothetical protein